MTGRRRTFLALYALSGAAALVYEVAWTRLLALQLGHTVAAASTVLAAFMGGLAIGAWVAGRIGARGTVATLRAYAGLELAIAIAAFALPFALRATVPLLAWSYADGNAPALFGIVRVVVSLLIVGIPAAAMGATFPIAADAVAASTSDAGALYAANTAGAALGAIASGFWLVPALGIRGTTWIGMGLNVAAAAGALWLSTRNAKDAKDAKDAKEILTKTKNQKPLRPSRPLRSSSPATTPELAFGAAGISGFAALVYEVAWTRLLALVIGPTTYAFATMAASFIAGLAIGSAAGTAVARRTERPAMWLAVLLVAGSTAATATAWYAATQLPIDVAVQVADPFAELAAIVWRQALIVGVLLLPMTLALGATFPLALAAAGGTSISRAAASVYAANTCGAIAGALAAGFLLIPSLGLRATIRDTAVGAAIAGVALLVRVTRVRLAPLAFSAACLAAIVFTPSWDRALLASGAYKYAPYLGGADVDAVLRAGRMVYYKEGSAGAVSVRDLTGTRSLSIDGKVDASNGGDMLTQRLLGLIPVLLHGNPRDIAVIGLGSGVTVGSALAVDTVAHADVVEISPEVVEASRYFDRESGNPLGQPRVRLVVGDGRSHLLLSPRSYDVIVSEPSNPWMAGVATLFTREFFEAARARLKPGGLLCQWAHTYDIRPDDLRSIVATFASVFPQATMWLVGGGDLLLIGARDGDITSRLATIERGAGEAAKKIDAALADVGLARGTSGFALLSMFAAGPQDVARFAGNSVIQTDDRTALEYSAPRGIYGRTKDDNAASIRTLSADPPPAVRAALDRGDDRAWASRAAMDLRAQAFGSAYDTFRRAVTLNSRNSTALAGLSDAAGGANRLDEERAWLETIARRETDNAAVRIELSRVLAVMGDNRAALEAAAGALQLTPDDPRAAEQFASVLADSGDAARLGPLAAQMIVRFPGRADPPFYQASALFMSGKTAEAADAVRAVVAAHPGHARAQGLLGAACAALGRRECARAAFDAAIGGSPRDPAGYVNAGTFELDVANPSAAADYFASALAIDPSSTSARTGLARARALLER